MSRRKLKALNYPKHDAFDPNSDEQLQTLVVWLEEMKIRAYKIEDREPLRTFDQSWPQHFSQYLSEIQCPYANVSTQKEERVRVVDWLLSYAIGLEYSDNASQINESAQKYLDEKKVESHAMDISSTNLDDPEFQKSLSALASTLNLPPHDNPSVLLSAVVNLLQRKFSPLALQEAQKSYEQEKGESSGSKNNNNNISQLDTSDFPLGFDTNDDILNKAATVLRLLYIADMRELQTKINDLIVIAQFFTANPKTNTRIGKLGR
eukprot:TRINITY_DN476_c0_g1_i2.p1 TRINITY_DN476_c0_g1~~TRINITY_DN476_c0_g1_i2.p1  ORF type:complete len:263 (-),score=57.05 TRINITY_DN476_c0_g1_i2:63-851(-)